MQWKIRENVYFVSTINHFVNMLEKLARIQVMPVMKLLVLNFLIHDMIALSLLGKKSQ